VRRVELREKGVSTLGGVKIWWDEMTGRLNGEGRGKFMGEFDGDDRILALYNDGSYELTNYELINRYEPSEMYLIQKFYPELIINCIYLDGKSKQQFVKRFKIETFLNS
jgi:topoisomerase-4 subunit A